ncbi:helix-turn-helix transcriptional regulator [Novispirillum itersonii]|uniref:Putative DNA-binding transcriptional regulator YafY n=1 Tax=Novispirillum itersonii TaxID=189 RepID=A0A7W9ZKR5_NOVIT|nr:YafY family protein [Novispirillum itersonii]MBB6212034.1 putative DNA-binding transcriptional regulator YafY [Novispirillum itersonii]
MRASRLLTLLTLLQARGRVTAPQLAAETGVSVRTIFRDIDHLALAGVPVYAERGPDGGYRLLDGYRVRLNGLSPAEAEALFMTGLPGPAADLGLGAVVASAERKLAVALPEDLRHSADRLRSRFHLDPPGWYSEAESPHSLASLSDAVWNHKRIHMRYRSWKKEKQVTTEPLGLVLKGGAWYMVARTDGTARTYRVARVDDLLVTAETFTPPPEFDLAAYWRDSTDRLAAEMHPGTARIRLSEWGRKLAPHVLSPYAYSRLTLNGPPDADGWQDATLPVGSLLHTAREFLRFGTDAEVLDPPELRQAITEAVAGLAQMYR